MKKWKTNMEEFQTEKSKIDEIFLERIYQNKYEEYCDCENFKDWVNWAKKNDKKEIEKNYHVDAERLLKRFPEYLNQMEKECKSACRD